jgi:membrane protease YdiL (CAAX protease family)
MHILSLTIDVVLAGYVIWEVVQFVPSYRLLKEAVARGDVDARKRIYQQAFAFEWISALLALAALGFDWNRLNPKFLALDSAGLMQSLPQGKDFDRGGIAGLLIGLAAGTLGLMVARIRANRRGATRSVDAPAPWWRKLLPDFSALIPVTTQERFFWAAVAISAGICEEVVFRGWPLSILHGQVGLDGTALVLVAAALFGLAHAYQRITGVILTAIAGAFFCVLYVKTGSLLVPIVLHILIDLRFAVLPAPRGQKPQTSYA